MNSTIKKVALTGISTLMIFSASVLPSFASDNHHKSDYSNKKLVVQTVTETSDGGFLSRTVTHPIKGHNLKGKFTAQEKQCLKDKLKEKIKNLTPEQRQAFFDRIKAHRGKK